VRGEAGQATVEWTALVVVAALCLGAFLSTSAAFDGRSLGGLLAHRLLCAAKGGCRYGDALLARVYGRRDAALVRAHAPGLVYERGERQIPVDWRRCRRVRCAEAPDERDLDVHRSTPGQRATIFTHVVRRRGRLYLQYWLYYPDSNSAWAGSDWVWERRHLIPVVGTALLALGDYPGFHRDDWESYFVRIDPDGDVLARASAHGHWQGCGERECRDRWIAASGWTRVSRGSHAGHIPTRLAPRPAAVPDDRAGGRRSAGPPGPPGASFPGFRPVPMRRLPLLPGPDLHDRTSTADGLRLIPLEPRAGRPYRPLDRRIRPPWRKDAYGDPERGGS
jgi:hypothetical protein